MVNPVLGSGNMQNACHNSVEGLVGNEEVEQMSAWYALAACGIHQLCPGNNRYELFSPVFDSISIHPGSSARTFSVIARNNTLANKYIQSAKLNWKAYNHCFIYHRDIVNGSTLKLVMGPEPKKEWGKDE